VQKHPGSGGIHGKDNQEKKNRALGDGLNWQPQLAGEVGGALLVSEQTSNIFLGNDAFKVPSLHWIS
jgi:hypothetical protein